MYIDVKASTSGYIQMALCQKIRHNAINHIIKYKIPLVTAP